MAKKRQSRFRSTDDEARRATMAHAEHLRTLGEAMTRAVDKYIAGHNASLAESENGWREDFAVNFADAAEEFHRAVAEAPKRVHEVFDSERPEATVAAERTNPTT